MIDFLTQLRLLLITHPIEVDFTIEEDRESLLPCVDIDNRVINFSNSAPVYFILSQFASSDLALQYAVLFETAAQHRYKDAYELLNAAQEMFNNETEKISQELNNKQRRILHQLIFLFFHEIAHGIFSINSSTKSKHLNCVTDGEIDYAVDFTFGILQFDVVSSRILRWLLRFIYRWRKKALKREVSNYLKQPENREEIACDIFAMAEWVKYMESMNSLYDDVLIEFLQSIVALHYSQLLLHGLNISTDKTTNGLDGLYENVFSMSSMTRTNFINLKIIRLALSFKLDDMLDDAVAEFKNYNLINILNSRKRLDGAITKLKEGSIWIVRKEKEAFYNELKAFDNKVLNLLNFSSTKDG